MRRLLMLGYIVLVAMTLERLIFHSPSVNAEPKFVDSTLTEISLVSVTPGFISGTTGEVSRFLWEPSRYQPAPKEIFAEVVVSPFLPGTSVTVDLFCDR